MRLSPPGLVAALVAMAVPRLAMATCTSPIDGATSCNGGGVLPICAGTMIFECDLDRNGGSSDSEGVVVLDTTGAWCTAGYYCAFGIEANGNGYCCEVGGPGVTVSRIDLIGAAGSDTLAFQFDDGTTSHQLRNAGTTSIVAWAYGSTGDDTIDGSPYWDAVNLRYDEYLNGEGGNDELFGWSGEDSLVGNANNDTLHGGADADYLGAGFGDDVVLGDGGADTVYGEGQADAVNGGTGADTIFGGGQSDTLCGGDDTFGGAPCTGTTTTTPHGAEAHVDATATRGLVVDSGDVLACSAGSLALWHSAEGRTEILSTSCAAVGRGAGIVVTDPDGQPAAIFEAAQTVRAQEAPETTGYAHRLGAVAGDDRYLVVASLPGSGLHWTDPASGEVPRTVVPTGAVGPFWGLSIVDGTLLLLDEGRVEDESRGQHLRWYDLGTMEVLGSVPVNLEPGEYARGLDCAPS